MSIVRSEVPFRLDRLPWSRWHWVVVIGLGITWILDGLEVTVVGAIGPRLQDRIALDLTATEVGSAASSYLLGAVIGSLTFGVLTDRFGRKKLFLITLGLYLIATIATAFSWNFWSFVVFRFITGAGIGGEYSAINSTVDELIPARHRGAVDLAINGTWWFGTILGSALSIVLLDPHVVNQAVGWRLTFGAGAVLGLAVLLVRRTLPESPRWLLTHGRASEADDVVRSIERAVSVTTPIPANEPLRTIQVDTEHRFTLPDVADVMLRQYPRRTMLALTLMIAQAFLYNAIFFTESLVLTKFFDVPAARVGYYIFPFAIGNLLGPLLLGRAFDVVGRRKMIGASYTISGVLLAGTAALFHARVLDANTVTACWSIVFFFASAGASAAYLTTSEVFPVEARAVAIAIVYAVGTLVGGVGAPALFGALVQSGSIDRVTAGYALGAVCMLAGGVVAFIYGIDAEGRSLEDVALPRSAVARAS